MSNALALLPVVCLSLVLLATTACSVQPKGDYDFTGSFRSDRKSPQAPPDEVVPQENKTVKK